jgi:hypothetical protein
MRLTPQDRETLELVVRLDAQDGPSLMPFFSNRQSVQRLVDEGLVEWIDAGVFLIPRPTDQGRAFLKGPN